MARRAAAKDKPRDTEVDGDDDKQEPEYYFAEKHDDDDAIRIIQSMSSGKQGTNSATIKCNGDLIPIEKNVNGHYRGLHIVLMDPPTGEVKEAKVFDTYEKAEELKAFIEAHKDSGYIVVAAC